MGKSARTGIIIAIVLMIACFSFSVIFFTAHYNEHESDVGHIENCAICQFVINNGNSLKNVTANAVAIFIGFVFAFVLSLGIVYFCLDRKTTPIVLKTKLTY